MGRGHETRRVAVAAAVAFLVVTVAAAFPLVCTATAGAVASAPRTPFPSAVTTPPVGLDAATREAEELQLRVDALQAEAEALDARISVLRSEIESQADVVSASRADEANARRRFDERLVAMYKAGDETPLALLVSSPTLTDALTRGSFLLALADRDRELLADATRRSAEAEYQARLLGRLRDREVALRSVHEKRLQAMRAALESKRALITRLNEQQRRYLAEREAAEKALRERWRASSFAGSLVPKVAAVVEEMPGITFLVDEGEPVRYRALDAPRTLVCSWYGNADNAPSPTATASGRAFNENEFTCASRTLPFGTRLALWRGDRHIVVVVTDRGPYVDGRDLDLSKSAAGALGLDGVGPVTARTVVSAR